MARVKKDVYVPGAHNVICDRTGFKVKSTDVSQEWNGLVVRRASWEARHPQDFVRAVRDDQSVGIPRPVIAGTYIGANTTLDADEAAGQTVLSVASTSDFVAGNAIIIHLDNEETHTATISSFVADDTVTISTALPSKASSGNTVSVIASTVSH